jgi:hypothetical protein
VSAAPSHVPSVAARVAALDWAGLLASLDQRGHAVAPALLDAEECRTLAALYADDGAFRSRVVMERHAFGRGEYKYLRYPLPPLVEALRQALYPRLAPLAERWRVLLRREGSFPPTLAEFLARCHAGGQREPTPLLLRYEAGGYNRLHQDLYGPLAFPLQATLLLGEPGHDFTGGEFLLVEQRPRTQSRGDVVPLRRGDAVIFAVSDRPVTGARGHVRVTLRHGVSRVHCGCRQTLGVIFHDAR